MPLSFSFLMPLAAAAPDAPCQSYADITVVFASRTFEIPPIGTVVGPPFEPGFANRATSGKSNLEFYWC